MAATDAATALVRFADTIRVREFNKDTDLQQVEQLEKNCEAGQVTGNVSLFTDLLGDPLCRVRQYPTYSMLVAEAHEPLNAIVGIIRAGVKQVVRGTYIATATHLEAHNCPPANPAYALVAYISGLRVSPSCRRLGIGLQLVRKMEEWCKDQGAVYVYMATENNNEPSLNLFIGKLGYRKFRTPTILVQPVYAKAIRLSSRIEIVKLNAVDAEILYRSATGTREFFPKDIDDILRSRLTMGTWLACYKGEGDIIGWLGGKDISWAVISVWRLNEIIKLEMKGVSAVMRGCATVTRWVDKLIPWLRIPSLPNVFKPFGLQIMYGLHAQGSSGGELLENLCWHVHNLAREEGCQVIVAEMGSCDPLTVNIPHWRRFSEQDLWCLKRLREADGQEDWTEIASSTSLFLDPRDF